MNLRKREHIPVPKRYEGDGTEAKIDVEARSRRRSGNCAATRHEGDGTEVQVDEEAPPCRHNGVYQPTPDEGNGAEVQTKEENPVRRRPGRPRKRSVRFSGVTDISSDPLNEVATQESENYAAQEPRPLSRLDFKSRAKVTRQLPIAGTEQKYIEDANCDGEKSGLQRPHSSNSHHVMASSPAKDIQTKYRRRKDYHPKLSLFEGNLCDEHGVPQFGIGKILERIEKERWKRRDPKNGSETLLQSVNKIQQEYDVRYSKAIGETWLLGGRATPAHESIAANPFNCPRDMRNMILDMMDSDEEENQEGETGVEYLSEFLQLHPRLQFTLMQNIDEDFVKTHYHEGCPTHHASRTLIGVTDAQRTSINVKMEDMKAGVGSWPTFGECDDGEKYLALRGLPKSLMQPDDVRTLLEE